MGRWRAVKGSPVDGRLPDRLGRIEFTLRLRTGHSSQVALHLPSRGRSYHFRLQAGNVSLDGTFTRQFKRLHRRTISPYLTGTPGTHRPQEFLTHFPHRHRNTLFSTYRQKDWKIIYSYASEEWELYNLEDDPFERRNLVGKRPDLALSLAKKLVQQLDSQKAMYPVSVSDDKDVKPNLGAL